MSRIIKPDPSISPREIFARMQGAWFEPRQGYMWQENTGATATTSGGQTIGLLLDQSQQAQLGSELVANSDFSNGLTGFTNSSAGGWATIIDNGGSITITGTPPSAGVNFFLVNTSAIPVSPGKYYEITVDRTGTVTGNPEIYFYNATPTSTFIGGFGFQSKPASQTYRYLSQTGVLYLHFVVWGTSPISITFDRVSVCEILGNHASQATAANRPLFGARRNLLVYSEQFYENVTLYSRWERYNLANVAANSELSPIGTMTADKLVENTANGIHGVVFFFASAALVSGATYTFSVYARSAERSILYLGENSGGDFVGAVFAYFNLATGSIGTKGSESIPNITAMGNGWYRCSITVTRSTGTIDVGLLCLTAPSDGVVSYAGSPNSGLYLWGAQFELGATATDYQRVTTATDYDAGRFPAIRHADSTDVLVASLPNLGSGVFSSAGSVYFSTTSGMSCLHNQSIGTTYNLPTLQTDIYGTVITPARLAPPLEQRLALYMHRLAGLSDADFFWQEQATDGMTGQLLADDNDTILLRA